MDYLLINSVSKIIENVIIWDGITQWEIPAGYFIEPAENSGAWIGWTRNEDGTFSPPVETN